MARKSESSSDVEIIYPDENVDPATIINFDRNVAKRQKLRPFSRSDRASAGPERYVFYGVCQCVCVCVCVCMNACTSDSHSHTPSLPPSHRLTSLQLTLPPLSLPISPLFSAAASMLHHPLDPSPAGSCDEAINDPTQKPIKKTQTKKPIRKTSLPTSYMGAPCSCSSRYRPLAMRACCTTRKKLVIKGAWGCVGCLG